MPRLFRIAFPLLLLSLSPLLWAQGGILISRAESNDPQAAGPAGTIESNTPIHINGSQAADKGNAVVFIGDKIETAKGAAAVITTEGSTVLVPAKTTVLFGDNVIDVGCGGALVTTVHGMSARLLDHRVGVYPSDTYAKFELNTAHGDLQVAVREGSATVVQTTEKEQTLPENSKMLQGPHSLTGFKYTFLTAGASLIIAGAGCPVAPAMLTTVVPATVGGAGAVAALATRGSTGGSGTPVTPVTP